MQFATRKNRLRVRLYPSRRTSILWSGLVALAPLICLMSVHVFGQDAEFQWANAYPLSSQGNMTEAEADHLGNIYSLGHFSGTIDADAGAGTQNITALGTRDLFLVKSDSGGNLIWAFQLGGTNEMTAGGLEIDAAGDIYIALHVYDTFDADPGPGVTTVSSTSAGNPDIGILKFDSDGNLIYARTIGGTGGDIVNSMSVDAEGSVYFSGYYDSSTIDLDPGTGTHTVTNEGATDFVIVKLDPNGDFVWGHSIGGTGDDQDRSSSLAANGDFYLLAAFHGTVDFDPGAGTYLLESEGGYDQAVVKFNSAGEFQWAFGIGGAADGAGGFLSLDAFDQNIYVTGDLRGSADFDPSASTSNLSSVGDQDSFIAKYDSNGAFIWAKRAGGSSDDFPRGIAVDSAGNVYSSGQFKSTPADFDPGAGTLILSSSGGVDGFLWSLTSSGDLRWAKRFGGSGNDIAMKVRLVGSSELLVTGTYQGTADLDPGPGTYTPPPGGSSGSPYLVNLLLLGGPNSAPTADAAGDVTIHWTQQGFTTIMGVGFDAESDPLTYSWSDVTGGGSIPLLSSMDTGSAGEADLDLIGLFFPIGPSTLQLEISDGQETASDEMVLTLTNAAPTADAGDNVMILSSEQSATVLAGTGIDADDDLLTYRWLDVTDGGSVELLGSTDVGSEGQASLILGTLPLFPIGESTLRLEVFDRVELDSQDIVLTIGNSPPDGTISGTGTVNLGDPILVGGTVSDFDGDLVDWELLDGAAVLASGQVQTVAGGAAELLPNVDLTGILGLGSHELVLTLFDGTNDVPSAATGTVFVKDNTNPTLTPVASISQLWPPNHTLVPVTIDVNADDNSGEPILITAAVMSDEPVDSTGDGNTEPDILIDSITNGPGGVIELQLRSERKGKGDGRTYTINIVAEDSSGNTSSAQIRVIAPHDKGKN